MRHFGRRRAATRDAGPLPSCLAAQAAVLLVGLAFCATLALGGCGNPAVSTTELPVGSTATSIVTESPTSPTSTTQTTASTAPSSTTTSSAPETGAKMAGSQGLGDSYYPLAGNGGYDAIHYLLDIAFDAATGGISGTTTITARATQDLDSFDLDFAGLKVQDVEVSSEKAAFTRDGQELRVECPARIHSGQTYTVSVRYSGVPRAIADQEGLKTGWQSSGQTVFVVDEPNGGMTWFPSNDQPRDKATYTFRITVAKPLTAVANGVLMATEDHGDTQTFVWEMREPMASYLAAVSVGRYELRTEGQAGTVAIRNYVAPGLEAAEAKYFSATKEQIEFFGGLFGPYPFDVYGVLLANADTDTGMENQTITLFGKDILDTMSDPIEAALYSSHELAHEWFGNSVSLKDWRDIWLNEGFATYASWLWVEHSQGPGALAGQVRESYGLATTENWPPPGDPGADNMFSDSVYLRGALTLHAVRLTVGDDTFFRILRQWTSRFKYSNVSTADFERLVGEVSGQDLSKLFRAWLYETAVPPLPRVR
jgi:aminopeptidase N